MDDHAWFRKLLDDLLMSSTIDFEGRPVPEWAQQILEERLANADKNRYLSIKETPGWLGPNSN